MAPLKGAPHKLEQRKFQLDITKQVFGQTPGNRPPKNWGNSILGGIQAQLDMVLSSLI